jgi:hypothetical protein
VGEQKTVEDPEASRSSRLEEREGRRRGSPKEWDWGMRLLAEERVGSAREWQDGLSVL